MKTVIAILAVVFSVCVQPVFGQQDSPMYDRSYSGPYNMYGQPTFTQLPSTQRQGGTATDQSGHNPESCRPDGRFRKLFVELHARTGPWSRLSLYGPARIRAGQYKLRPGFPLILATAANQPVLGIGL